MGRIANSIRSARREDRSKTRHLNVPNCTTTRRKVVPLLQREEIVQACLMGKSERQISRETGRHRQTIHEIISEANIPFYVKKVRERFIALGNVAIDTLADEIRKGDWRLAYKFLLDTGIISNFEACAMAAGPTLIKLTPESVNMVLESLSESDKQIFSVLQKFRENFRADAMSVDSIIPHVPPAPKT